MAGHDAFCEDDIISGRAPSSRAYKRKKVGGYILGQIIGSGSFARVCKGTHILTEERVAVKVIDKKLVEKREYVKRNLRREAAMLQRLHHPNIIQLYEVLETPNNYYLVLELADGQEFMTYLQDKKRFTERETRKFMRQLTSAVDHMHQADIIHRDIKIENLLLDRDCNLKMIDFGLSNMLGPDGFLQTQCGSPAYAAPEIFCNTEYGPAVDVWSMGVNMYAMLTGELPFKVDPPMNIPNLQKRILKGVEIPHMLTKDCKDLLRKMLEPNESSRIKVREIMRHSWINRGYSCKLFPSKFPVKPQENQLDETILNKMVDHGFDSAAVISSVIERKPVSSSATYHLMVMRLMSGYGYPDVETATVSEEETVSSTVSNTSTLRSAMECSKWNAVRKGFLKPKKRNYYDRTKGLRDVAFARKVARAQSEKQERRYVQTPTQEEVIEDMSKSMGISPRRDKDDVTASVSNLLPRRHDSEGMYYIQVALSADKKTSENDCDTNGKSENDAEVKARQVSAKCSPESAKVALSLQRERALQSGDGLLGEDGRPDSGNDEGTTFLTSCADEVAQAVREGRMSSNDDCYPDDIWKEIDIALNGNTSNTPSPLTPIEAVRRSNTFVETHDSNAKTKRVSDRNAKNGCIIIVNGQIKDERYQNRSKFGDNQNSKPAMPTLTSQYNRFARTKHSQINRPNRNNDTYVQRLGMYYGVPRPPRSKTVKSSQSARPTYYQPIKTQRSVLVQKPQNISTSKSYGKSDHTTASRGRGHYSLPLIATAAAISKPTH
ncbi:serine/threonine-protein kinase MARK1-like [Ptychodera flava]|uniref:serine/threonine-protein kinase MARK1-like n=1 Tax=Ptychodera flava TaxID=63121 RepID=UPI003969DEE1